MSKNVIKGLVALSLSYGVYTLIKEKKITEGKMDKQEVEQIIQEPTS